MGPSGGVLAWFGSSTLWLRLSVGVVCVSVRPGIVYCIVISILMY